MSDVHARMRRLVPAYRLGLLDGARALELRAHLRDCAECRALFDEFLEPTDDEVTRPGHVQVGLIARWESLAPQLAEGERSLLEEHFAGCDTCREAREFARGLRAAHRPKRSRPPWKWIGFGTAAMAAVVAAVIATTLREPPRVAPAPGPAPTNEPEPVPAPRVVRAPLLFLKSPDRGGSTRTVVVPEGATVLPIRVPPLLGVGPTARIAVRALGPGGEDFGRAEVAHSALFGTSRTPTLEAKAPEGPLPAGHYRVEVGSDAPDPQVPGTFEHAEYDFDLRVAD